MFTAAEVLLDQARLQIDRQEKKFDALRTTAGTVLGAGGVIVGLIAALLGTKLGSWSLGFGATAIASFAIGTTAAVRVLTPKNAHFAGELAESTSWVEANPGADGEALSLTLARLLDENRRSNEATLLAMATQLTRLCRSYGLAAVCWAVAALVR